MSKRSLKFHQCIIMRAAKAVGEELLSRHVGQLPTGYSHSEKGVYSSDSSAAHSLCDTGVVLLARARRHSIGCGTAICGYVPILRGSICYQSLVCVATYAWPWCTRVRTCTGAAYGLQLLINIVLASNAAHRRQILLRQQVGRHCGARGTHAEPVR